MKNVERTYLDTWKNRDEALKELDYIQYLKSDDWLKIKNKLHSDKRYSNCINCFSSKNIHLHHRNYKWIGTKKAAMGLLPLCSDCHNKVHEYAKEKGVAIRVATNIVCKQAYLKMYGKKKKII